MTLGKPWWEDARERLERDPKYAEAREVQNWIDILDGHISGPSDELLESDPDPISIDWLDGRRGNGTAGRIGVAPQLCEPHRNFAVDVTRLSRQHDVDLLLLLQTPREALPSAFNPNYGLGFDLAMDIVWTAKDPEDTADIDVGSFWTRLQKGDRIVVWSRTPETAMRTAVRIRDGGI